jgi:hypothetical protein
VIVSLKRLNKSNVSAVMQRSLSTCCSCWRDNRSSHRARLAFRRSVPSVTDTRRLPLHDGQAREVFFATGKLRNLRTFVRSYICDRSMLSPGSSAQWAPHLARELGLADGATNGRARSSGLPFAIRSASYPIASGGHLGDDGITVLETNLRRKIARERSFSGRCVDHLHNNHFCKNATLNYNVFWNRT